MTPRPRGDRLGRPATPSASDEWLASVAVSAAADARAPAELLGEYLSLLADAAINGRRPDAWELDAVRELGRRAAAQGVGARRAVDLDAVHARDLLVYRVLGRDQAAIVDLVRDVLAPLDRARGGPEVLLATLREYFEAGEVATEAARRLHVSVRTVTYRLARVAQLTGYSVSRPDQRFALHAALLGARLLE